LSGSPPPFDDNAFPYILIYFGLFFLYDYCLLISLLGMAGMGYVLDDYNFHHAVAVMRNHIKKKKIKTSLPFTQ